MASDTTTALEIGDEPMQFHLKFPDLAVAVGEERIVAIPQLLHDRPDLQAIILDDAFQHREVRAGFNILLTAYGDIYTKDFFLPTGDLRDQPASAKRADIIIVTKCPATLTANERNELVNELEPEKGQQVFLPPLNTACLIIFSAGKKKLQRQRRSAARIRHCQPGTVEEICCAQSRNLRANELQRSSYFSDRRS